jgi:hypothetical protein
MGYQKMNALIVIVKETDVGFIENFRETILTYSHLPTEWLSPPICKFGSDYLYVFACVGGKHRSQANFEEVAQKFVELLKTRCCTVLGVSFGFDKECPHMTYYTGGFSEYVSEHGLFDAHLDGNKIFDSIDHGGWSAPKPYEKYQRRIER